MPEEDLPTENAKSSSSSADSSSIEHLPSSLSSLSVQEDLVELGGEAIYQPVVFPKEPKLDELLRNVSGSQDLQTLFEVNLKLSSSMVCIQRLEVFLPNLVSLNLDGSSLTSLRDLGTGLMIKYLNVSRCGLTTLDGTNGLTTLIHFVVESNMIRDVSPIFNLSDLRKLNLRGNLIDNMGVVSFLTLCPDLIELDLICNPVCYIDNYRSEVKKNVPNLILLDGMPLNGPSNEGSCEVGNTSSEFSSISDQTRSDTSNEIVPINPQLNRPNSSGNIYTSDSSTKIRINRPSTADPANPSTSTSLSSGEPVCGNVISRLRFNRRNKRTAWATSESSSSISSSTDSISAKDFPVIIPQKSVDLELGVLGVGCDSSSIRLSEHDDHAKLLLAAKKWRKKCQQTLSESERIDRIVLQ